MGLSVTSPQGSATHGIGVAVSFCRQPRYTVPCGPRPSGLFTAIPSSFPLSGNLLRGYRLLLRPLGRIAMIGNTKQIASAALRGSLAMTALIHGAAGEAVCGAGCKLAALRRGGGVATSHRSLSAAFLHPSCI
jgi:hypothetical protein